MYIVVHWYCFEFDRIKKMFVRDRDIFEFLYRPVLRYIFYYLIRGEKDETRKTLSLGREISLSTGPPVLLILKSII